MEMAGESFYKYMAYEKAAASVENAPPLRRPRRGRRAPQAARHRQVDRRRGRSTRAHRQDGCARGAPRTLSAFDFGGARRKRDRHEDGGNALHRLRHRIACRSRSARSPRAPSPACRDWGAKPSRTGAAAFSPIGAGNAARRLPQALIVAYEAMEYVRDGPPLERLCYAGSLRRCEVTVGDIDLVCTSVAGGRRDRAFHHVVARASRARRRPDEGEHLAARRFADRLARPARSSLRQPAAAFYRLARAQHQAARVRRPRRVCA